MMQRSARLSEITPDELAALRAEANELAELQGLLNRLPMGLQIENLSEPELARLRQLAKAPEAMLCGDGLLLWNNLCRSRTGLTPPS